MLGLFSYVIKTFKILWELEQLGRALTQRQVPVEVLAVDGVVGVLLHHALGLVLEALYGLVSPPLAQVALVVVHPTWTQNISTRCIFFFFLYLVHCYFEIGVAFQVWCVRHTALVKCILRRLFSFESPLRCCVTQFNFLHIFMFSES